MSDEHLSEARDFVDQNDIKLIYTPLDTDPDKINADEHK